MHADDAEIQPGRSDQVKLIVVLGLLVAIGPLTIDMYLPALPTIAAQLHASAAAAQLTLTGTLFGLAIGQLAIGPFSDAVGRRTPLIAGVALHIIASLLCAVAPGIAVLGALRVLQGLGMAAAAVVASAVVRDRFSGDLAAKTFSRLFLVMGVAPILAPTLGSQLLRLTSWRGVFIALAVLGAGILALAVLALPETLPPAKRRRGGFAGTLADYRNLLRDRVFLGLVVVAGFSVASLFSYVSGSSFVYQEQYGLNAQQFGLLFGAGAAAFILSSQLNVRLLNRYSSQQILTAALMSGSLGGLALLFFAATGFGGLATIVVSVWVVLGAGGLAIPNAPALALTRHGEAAGTAAALLGAAQFGLGAIVAPAVGAIGTGALAMSVVVAGSMVSALTVLLITARPSQLAAAESST
jgi:DHA1 family bicyclomycin/chloramphenicol resistance-like MFS transporter